MAPKKSTEQTATPVSAPAATPVSTPAATPVSAPAATPVTTEKPKKVKSVKKSEQSEPSAVVAPAAPAPAATSTAATPAAEKPKKSKKAEQPAAPVVAAPVEQTENVVAEKPKKSSKKKAQAESSPVVEQTSESSSEQPSETVTEPKKRSSKKKVKSQDSETQVTEAGSESSEVPEKRVRKVVNQETLKADVEQLKQQVEDEIQRLRTDQQKNKGAKFLKVVNKLLKTLSGDLNRVLKSKTKTVRNKNTSSGFMKPVKISSEMALFTKWDPSSLYSRVDVTKFLCAYIKSNSLQNPEDRRQILCDEKLASLLKVDTNSETPLTYPGLQQHIQQHFITDTSSVSEEVVQP
jgi:chromatin remodeling complex protein RSC6